MATGTSPTAPIHDEADLRQYFALGEKPRAAHRVGVEHEKIAVFASGEAPSYEAAIAPLLEGLVHTGRWEGVYEGDVLIAARSGAASVTLEPGGQFELSDEPRANARQARDAVIEHGRILAPLTEALGITFVATGFRPLGTLEQVPWMPKGRYRVMREYLPTRGKLPHEMMKRTATVQANLDYADQADCAEKLRTAMGVTSLITALWASSPLEGGAPTGYQSYRARAWLDTDSDRCGLLPWVFEPGLEEQVYARYTEWALDVPMFFVHRGGEYLPVGGITFRRYLREGFAAERASMGDWEVHLSTLFPEVRLKHYLEIRGADSGSYTMVAALPALCRGLLYDRESRYAAWQLVAGWSIEEREQLRREVPRDGIRARIRNRPVLQLCNELIAIAKVGLIRLGDGDASLLEPLEEIVREGTTVADRIVAAHANCRTVPDLIEALRLQ